MSDIVQLRRKIARWHLALQQRHVDRDWPALEIIMREMAREAGLGNEATSPLGTDPPSTSTLPADKAIRWGRHDGVWHAFGDPPDKSACRRVEFLGSLDAAPPGTTVVGVTCDRCITAWRIGGRH